MLYCEDLWGLLLTMFCLHRIMQVDYMCDANLRFSHSGASSVFITGYKSTTSLAMMDDDDDDDDEEEARALTRGEIDEEDDEEDEEDDDDGFDVPAAVPMNGTATAKQKVPPACWPRSAARAYAAGPGESICRHCWRGHVSNKFNMYNFKLWHLQVEAACACMHLFWRQLGWEHDCRQRCASKKFAWLGIC